MRERLLHALLATAIGCGLLASTTMAGGRAGAHRPGPMAGCPTPGLAAPVASQESAMSCLIGEARRRHGLAPLSPSITLSGSALEKGADLLRCDEFSHTACGREFSFWIRAGAYMSTECWRVGENLAWGVDEQGTVIAIFRAWMRSPTHRANILGDFEETGIDLRIGRLGGLTGVHLWTQHFGSHCRA
jgi:uncharacterized protein YkwD